MNRNKIKVEKKPGQVVRINQLIRPTVGLILTHSSIPTTVARGCHRPTNTQLLTPVKGLRDPTTMTLEQGGGGGGKRTGTGDVETAGRTAGPSGSGERGATKKILSR